MLYTSAQIQIHLTTMSQKTIFSSLTRLMLYTNLSEVLQGLKSVHTKVPSCKQCEMSKIPTYQRKKLVPNDFSFDSSEDENISLDTTSNESKLCEMPTLELKEDEKITFEDAIIFDAHYIAFIGKEEVRNCPSEKMGSL